MIKNDYSASCAPVRLMFKTLSQKLHLYVMFSD
jgi:hypothetical protein